MSAPSQNSFVSSLGPLLALVWIFFLNFSSRLLLGPLHLPLAHMGLFLAAVACGYSLGVLASSQTAHMVTHRKNVALSMILLGVSMLAAGWSRGPVGLGLSLVGLGASAGLYLPSGVASMTGFVPSRHWGKAFALHECAPSLAFVLTPLLAEFFLSLAGWREAFSGMGVLCLVSGTWYWLRGKTGNFSSPGFSWARVRFYIRHPYFLIAAGGFSLAIGAEIGLFHLTTAYLVRDHGLLRSDANLFLALSRVFSFTTTFLAGWIVDRFGIRAAFALSFGLAGVVTAGIGLAGFSVAGALLFIQPVLVISFFPAGFSVLSRLSPDGSTDLAVALAVTVASTVGGGLIPGTMAWVGDHFGLWVAFAAMGTLMFAYLPLLLKIRV